MYTHITPYHQCGVAAHVSNVGAAVAIGHRCKLFWLHVVTDIDVPKVDLEQGRPTLVYAMGLCMYCMYCMYYMYGMYCLYCIY